MRGSRIRRDAKLAGESGGLRRLGIRRRTGRRVHGADGGAPEHIAPNGFLQASVVIALADMLCARGTMDTIPAGANFTTLELKTNLIATARKGIVRCDATLQHGGRTTQVWDATATVEETGRKIALFRCTQLILYPQ